MSETEISRLELLRATDTAPSGAVQYWDAQGHLIAEDETIPAEYVMALVGAAPQLFAAARERDALRAERDALAERLRYLLFAAWVETSENQNKVLKAEWSLTVSQFAWLKEPLTAAPTDPGSAE